jgi:murein L,D-transpeptidase YcbB/YkuD
MDLLHELGYNYTSKKNTWVTLEKQIPVYVEYHTVWVDDEGVVQFRNDIYGYEKKLFSKTTFHPNASKYSKKKVVKKDKGLELF